MGSSGFFFFLQVIEFLMFMTFRYNTKYSELTLYVFTHKNCFQNN